MVARIARVEAVPCDSAHEAAWLERNLLEYRKPPWNRSPNGGQEVEVWIRLGEFAGASGRDAASARLAYEFAARLQAAGLGRRRPYPPGWVKW